MTEWYRKDENPPCDIELWVYASTLSGLGVWRGVFDGNKWFTGCGETRVYFWTELTDSQPSEPLAIDWINYLLDIDTNL